MVRVCPGESGSLRGPLESETTVASKKKSVRIWMARVFKALEFRSPTEPVKYGATWNLVWKMGNGSYKLTVPMAGKDPSDPENHVAVGMASDLDEMTALYATKVLGLD